MGKCLFLRKGETHTAPISGILASDLAVGSSVYLMENGTAAEYLVVHQGLPSSMYDESCNGCYLLRKDLYGKRQWHSSDSNSYKASTIHSYLNSTFLGLFDSDIQSIIKQVKIPYVNGTGSSAVSSGANGLSAKIFLLGGYEIGWTQSIYSSIPIDGSCLDYFIGTSTADNKRIAYLNGTIQNWWLRSPTNNDRTVWSVSTDGGTASNSANVSYSIRPALILPSTALFDKNTLILKGVA